MILNLDTKYDVLYVTIADRSRSYGDESDDGVVTMRDMATDEITGFIIFDFMEKYKAGILPKLNLPVKIIFSLSDIQRMQKGKIVI